MTSDIARVALYARVSGDQQAEAGTIGSQVEALKARIAQEGLTVEEELCFIDDGYVGATLVRPALERLRDMVAAGAIDRIYVHSPDRLARKYAWQVLLVEEFQRCGVELIFLNRELGKSPEDDLLLQVQGMIAEYERAKIMERSRRGKLHAARQGKINVLSGAPYGYRYIPGSEGDGVARYEIILEEARVVQQVFAWIGQDRLSMGEVVRRLKRQGIPSRRGKNYWERTTIWGMLKNPAYQGTAAFGRTRVNGLKPPSRPHRGKPLVSKRPYARCDVPPDQWTLIPVPALVSKDLFQTVQEQLAENRKRSRQSLRGARYLLQGLLVCKHCGYAYYGKPISPAAAKHKPRRYTYYRCSGTDAYRFGGQRVCFSTQVRTDQLDQAVWQDVCSLLSNPQRVEEEFKRRLTVKPKGIEWQSIEQLQALLGKVKRGMARITDAYEDGLIEKKEFERRIKQAKGRLEKLQTQVKEQMDEETRRKELRLVIGHLQEFADHVKNGLETADWSTRRQILRTLIKQVEIDQEEIRVAYRVSPPPFVEASDNQIMQDCWRRVGGLSERARGEGQ